MHKKAVALILSCALISLNSEGVIIYAQENIQEKEQISITEELNKEDSKIEEQGRIANKEDSKDLKQGIEEANIHNVHNTEELQNAIDNAKQGDIIKVYEGTYSNAEITIEKSNITIQGYSLDDNLISNNTDAIVTNTKFYIYGDNITLNGVETKDIKIGCNLVFNKIVPNNTKIINCSVKGALYIGDSFGENLSNNTLVEGCYISSFINVNGSNNVIRNTETPTIEIDDDNTLVDKCDISFLEIGSRERIVKNIKVQDTKISRFLELGKDNKTASDVTLERVDIYAAYIGYSSGTANNVSILDSRIDKCMMGSTNRGKTTNTSIINTDINELSIGGYSGISKNTKILNSNITQELYIGKNEGTAEDTYISNSNISKKSDTFTSVSLWIGVSGGNAKNTKILNSNIYGDVSIGDTNLASNPINTFIETNNTNIVDMGKNTFIFNYLNDGINKLKGQASQGLRAELINDGVTLIDTVVDNDKIVDKYLKEEDYNFSLSSGDKVILNIYDSNNNKIFSENMSIKDLVVSLPKPKVNEVSNTNTGIAGYVKAYSKVFVLKENQKESDEGVLTTRANRDGYFKIEDDSLKGGESLRIYSRDNANNISEVLEIKVLDKTSPNFISVEEVTDKSYSIKGKVSEANATINAETHDAFIGSATSDNDGNFEIFVQPGQLRGNQSIILTSYDSANNTSHYFINVKETIVFKDVDGHWASNDIYYFTSKGYINGYSDNTFRPNNQITRAEFVKIVNNVYGFSEVGEIKFTDVSQDAWYAKDVAIAVKAGYINGKSEIIFDPDAPLTRQEAAKIISVIKGCYDTEYNMLESFNDKSSVSSWAMPYVEGVIEAGYMSGYSDNTFKPNQSITRAEAVVTLKRTL
ncbi:S-layer homology domain-containing protein [Romboutsia ilealis]|uniref:S-layer homology domain-containing protein n=1 Tax=Romboutsia ilealis TaxID=1115758 RepID=UPI0025703E45|nr:S-layer homology domain-containing protein [Romboutsia ilealis]